MFEVAGIEYDSADNQRVPRAMIFVMTLQKKQEIMKARHQRE